MKMKGRFVASGVFEDFKTRTRWIGQWPKVNGNTPFKNSSGDIVYYPSEIEEVIDPYSCIAFEPLLLYSINDATPFCRGAERLNANDSYDVTHVFKIAEQRGVIGDLPYKIENLVNPCCKGTEIACAYLNLEHSQDGTILIGVRNTGRNPIGGRFKRIVHAKIQPGNLLIIGLYPHQPK